MTRAAAPRPALVVAAILAAAPSVAATRDAGWLADDWGFAAAARRAPADWFLHGLDVRFRPVQALTHWLTFEAFASRPAAALLLLACAEVLVVLLLHRLVRTTAGAHLADATCLVWALLPNRSAPRLWVSALPVSLAVALLLLAATMAVTTRRPWAATALCCAMVLTYEAGVVLGLAVIAVAWFDASLPRRDQLVRWARPAAVYGAFVVWNVATSPKTPASPLVGTGFVDALAGAGLTPRALGPMGTVVGLAVTVAAVLVARLDADTLRWAAVGGAVVVAGVAPLLAVGASPVVDGPVDRMNVIPALGVAALLAAGVVAAGRRVPGPALAVAATALAVVALVGQSDDVTAARSARRDGAATIAAFDEARGLWDRALVLDPGPSHGGWTAFGWDSLQPAIELRTGRRLDVRDPPRVLLDPRPDETVVRVEDGRLVPSA